MQIMLIRQEDISIRNDDREKQITYSIYTVSVIEEEFRILTSRHKIHTSTLTGKRTYPPSYPPIHIHTHKHTHTHSHVERTLLGKQRAFRVLHCLITNSLPYTGLSKIINTIKKNDGKR